MSETSAEHTPPHQPSASTLNAEDTVPKNVTITTEHIPPRESSSVMLNHTETAPQNAVEHTITTEDVPPVGSSSPTTILGCIAWKGKPQLNVVPRKLFPMTGFTVQFEDIKLDEFAVPDMDDEGFTPVTLGVSKQPGDNETNDTSLLTALETETTFCETPFGETPGRKLSISSEFESSPFDFQDQVESTVQLGAEINNAAINTCSGIHYSINESGVLIPSSRVVDSRLTSTSDTEDHPNPSLPILSNVEQRGDQPPSSDNFSMTSSMTMFLRSPLQSDYEGFEGEILERLDSDSEDQSISSDSEQGGVPIKDRYTFLDLPLDARNAIYKYCLPTNTKRSLICQWAWSPQPPPFTSNVRNIWPPIAHCVPAFDSSIMALNKRIFAEVAAVLYARYTFRFTSSHLENCYFNATIFTSLRTIEIEDMRARVDLSRLQTVLEQLSARPNVGSIFVGTRAADQMCGSTRSAPFAPTPEMPWVNRAVAEPKPVVPYWLTLKSRVWPALPKVVLVEFRVPVASALVN